MQTSATGRIDVDLSARDGEVMSRVMGLARGMRSVTAPAARISGFTLIEVLVVVVIAAVLVGAAMLAIGGSGDRELENAARRAEQRLRLACERAVFTGNDVGFSVIDQNLRFGYLLPGRWAPVANASDEVLRTRPLGKDVRVKAFREGLAVAEDDESTMPQFACFASGELTPLQMDIDRDGARGGWRLVGHVDGRLELSRVDE